MHRKSTGEWIRIKGKEVFDDREEVVNKVFTVMPQLKDMYTNNGWEMGPFYLDDISAEIADMSGGFKKIC